ncbi:MAG TPA: hypothetical protein VNQ74_07185, partial [Burkholderiaceae bacterium]|nr:hypothetical protein [Burkholderiaceae bacterium]
SLLRNTVRRCLPVQQVDEPTYRRVSVPTKLKATTNTVQLSELNPNSVRAEVSKPKPAHPEVSKDQAKATLKKVHRSLGECVEL